MTDAYADTSVSGDPFEPVHGRGVTAAEMILDDPSAERSDLKNDSRFAASDDECGLPAPLSFGYSYMRTRSCQRLCFRFGGEKTYPVDVDAIKAVSVDCADARVDEGCAVGRRAHCLREVRATAPPTYRNGIS